MDRFVVLVDAGYFLRQSIEILSSKTCTRRSELEITDPHALVRLLIDKSKAALELTSKELLRVYWYDGVGVSGYTQQQRTILALPDVQFRAGTVNGAGQQKGVDSLIVTNLIELASNRAISDAILITGDSDLAIGIELTQKKGVRIAVMGLEDLSAGVSHKQSPEITSLADRVHRIGGAELSAVMRHAPPAPTIATATAMTRPTPAMPKAGACATPAQAPLFPLDRPAIDRAVDSFIATQADPHAAVDPSTKRIDAAIDRLLVHHVYLALGKGRLTPAEKAHLRESFRDKVGIT